MSGYVNSFDIFKDYIDYVINTDTTLFCCRSRAGLAKTFTVLTKLKELGLTAGQDFIYLNGFVTPLELFETLMTNQSKLIVLDDLGGLTKDKKNIDMLKSATYPSLDGKRVVQYASSKREAQQSAFICSSKFIILCNETPKGESWKAVQSRGIFYDLKPSNVEVLEAILGHHSSDVGIVEFMRDTMGNHVPMNFRQFETLRGLKKAFPDKWRDLAMPILQTHDKYSFIRKLLDSGMSVNKQIEDYKAQGNSKSTYFRHKNKVQDEVSEGKKSQKS